GTRRAWGRASSERGAPGMAGATRQALPPRLRLPRTSAWRPAMSRSRLVLPLLLLLCACNSSLADREKQARVALDTRDFAKARQIAETALKDATPGKDAATSWRLEQIRLDALA